MPSSPEHKPLMSPTNPRLGAFNLAHSRDAAFPTQSDEVGQMFHRNSQSVARPIFWTRSTVEGSTPKPKSTQPPVPVNIYVSPPIPHPLSLSQKQPLLSSIVLSHSLVIVPFPSRASDRPTRSDLPYQQSRSKICSAPITTLPPR